MFDYKFLLAYDEISIEIENECDKIIKEIHRYNPIPNYEELYYDRFYNNKVFTKK